MLSTVSQEQAIRAQKRDNPNPISGKTTFVLPGFQRGQFESPDEMVVNQLDIKDFDDRFVRPWDVQKVLVEGALMCHSLARRLDYTGQADVPPRHREAQGSPPPGSAPLWHRPEAMLRWASTSTAQAGPSRGAGPSTKLGKANDGSRIQKGNNNKGKAKGKEEIAEMTEEDWEVVTNET